MTENNSSVQADVRRLCDMLGISLPTSNRAEKLIVKLLGVYSSATLALNERLNRQGQMIVRSSAAANQAWNMTNVLARALGDRLIERGIFQDRDELNRACEAAAKELRHEAEFGQSAEDERDPIGRAVRKALETPQARSSVAAALAEKAAPAECNTCRVAGECTEHKPDAPCAYDHMPAKGGDDAQG